MALAVICPVIGKYPRRNEILIYGGGIHFSKEYVLNADGRPVFGYLTDIHGNDFTGIQYHSPVISLSQEHGILQMPDEQMNEMRIGDMVVIYPVHACLTANLYKQYVTFEKEIIERF